MLKEASWPEKARPILGDFLFTEDGKSRGNATPRFIIARDDKVILSAVGNAGWRDVIWPKIQDLLV